MARRPWIKWYPADWRGEPRLKMCSLAARGLWADLLAFCHEGEPYGHLTVEGVRPDEPAGLAALVGRPVLEVRKALAELDRFKVFARTDDGVIYSRRMVRDKAKEQQDIENGKRGGNPKLKGKDNGGVNPRDKAHKPEARDQIEANPTGLVVVLPSGKADPPEPDPFEIPENLKAENRMNGSKSEPTPVQKAFDNYNVAAREFGLPIASKLTEDRKRGIRARLKDHGLEGWNNALEAIGAQPFLRGDNKRNWRADLDFLCQPKSLNRVLEGSYGADE